MQPSSWKIKTRNITVLVKTRPIREIYDLQRQGTSRHPHSEVGSERSFQKSLHSWFSFIQEKRRRQRTTTSSCHQRLSSFGVFERSSFATDQSGRGPGSAFSPSLSTTLLCTSSLNKLYHDSALAWNVPLIPFKPLLDGCRKIGHSAFLLNEPRASINALQSFTWCSKYDSLTRTDERLSNSLTPPLY